MEIEIFTDGGSRGNPGPAAIGVVIKEKSGKKIYNIGRYIGISTNNDAEYKALLEGLSYLVEHFKVKSAEKKMGLNVSCFLDSELVVKQMNGEYKVKNPNIKTLWKKIKELERRFSSIEYVHIPREKNSEADYLVNQALDLAS
ncbi:MAG TPA: ribonuclease HI family protein [bacterium]|jgi:ribonuclease HI|nr:ribonuclease HI family protein [bacterium]